MRMSPHDPKKTRHAVLTGSIPNIQEIRMLPIFSVLLVRKNESATGNIEQSNRPFYQYGYCIGPSMNVKGAIRVAISQRDLVTVIGTSKHVSDSGGVNIYPLVSNGLRHMINDTENSGFPAQHNHVDDIPMHHDNNAEGEVDGRQKQVQDRKDRDDDDAPEVYDPGGLIKGQASCTKEG